MHLRFDMPIRKQRQATVSRSLATDTELLGTGFELNTAGGRRHPFDAIDTSVGFLVYVPPQHPPHIIVTGEQVFQSSTVFQPLLVDPEAAARQRLVMKANQRMLVGKLCQGGIEKRQLRLGYASANFTVYGRIQQDYLPVADKQSFGRVYLPGIQIFTHDPGIIMIAGNPEGWNFHALKIISKILVRLGGPILGQVTGGE